MGAGGSSAAKDAEPPVVAVFGPTAGGKTNFLFASKQLCDAARSGLTTTPWLYDPHNTIPTMGEQDVRVEIGRPNARCQPVRLVEVGGGNRIYPLWQHYLSPKFKEGGARVLVFAVDVDRMFREEETRTSSNPEKVNLMNDETESLRYLMGLPSRDCGRVAEPVAMRSVPLLVLCNVFSGDSDVDPTAQARRVSNLLGLQELILEEARLGRQGTPPRLFSVKTVCYRTGRGLEEALQWIAGVVESGAPEQD